MARLIVSLVLWGIFLAVTSAIVKLGFYASGYDIAVTWADAMWIGVIIRLMFLTNQVYDYVRKDLGL